jgi:glycosyltransferase involved in cell wall biosynthesis
MRPLRVLHVTPYAPDAWAYGGIPRLAGTLTRELARQGHLVTLAATDVRDGSRRLPRQGLTPPPGVTWRIFPNLSNHAAFRWQFFTPIGLGRFLRTEARRFDVAHLHACRNLPGTIAGRHLRRAGIPYLLAPNGTAPVLERRHLAKRVFDLTAGRDLVRHAAGVLAVSDAEARQFASCGIPPGRVHHVPNPVDLDEFNAPIARGRFRQRMGAGRAPLVVYLGQLTPRKRVDVLIRAFAGLGRPHARLVVAGSDGGEGRRLRGLVSAFDLDARAYFAGVLEGTERLEALADADLVVYPSEHEVFGLVPLEALLCGTPAIVGDDSGCGDVIRSTGGGLTVAPGDRPALTRAMENVLDHPAHWRAEAARAAQQVRARFGPSVVSEALTGVYRTLVAKAHR